VAVAITLPYIKITICNIYLPNQKNFTLTDLENITQQLHHSFIIVGDFNSLSSNWGSYKTDTRGKIIEELISQDNLVLLNTGQPTRINPSNGQLSFIDISISNTSLAHKLEWKVLPDIYSSDHIPIQISLTYPLNKNDSNYPQRWKSKKPIGTFFNSLIENGIIT
jgi:exonuclease III